MSRYLAESDIETAAIESRNQIILVRDENGTGNPA
jgi:hypothetical protein